MKKLLSLFLICSMYLGITACSKNNSKNDTSNENKSKSYVEMTYGQTYTINDSNGNFDISILCTFRDWHNIPPYILFIIPKTV